MKYVGLLTDEQKRAGYFVSQDDDFVYLWRNKDGKPDCIAIFLYDLVRVKQIRDTVIAHFSGQHLGRAAAYNPLVCPGLNDCPKVEMVLDKDLAADWQYAQAIRDVCRQCKERLSGDG